MQSSRTGSESALSESVEDDHHGLLDTEPHEDIGRRQSRESRESRLSREYDRAHKTAKEYCVLNMLYMLAIFLMVSVVTLSAITRKAPVPLTMSEALATVSIAAACLLYTSPSPRDS